MPAWRVCLWKFPKVASASNQEVKLLTGLRGAASCVHPIVIFIIFQIQTVPLKPATVFGHVLAVSVLISVTDVTGVETVDLMCSYQCHNSFGD